MRHPLNLLKGISQHFPLLVLLTLSLSTGWTSARAATPDTAPPELKNAISQIDAAANSRNVQAVMQFFSPNFTHSDGLNRQSMEKTLTQLWQLYPQLNYRTELVSWESQGGRIVAETVTKITGTQPVQGRDWTFNSTIRSRQGFENQKIVSQEILSEQTQLASGQKPPTLDVRLPAQVRTNQEYNLDVIVKEPLGDDLLVGTALQEPVKADKYINNSPIELEGLDAGGIFKVGRAPAQEGKYWISTVLIRADGMTVYTQRLPVVNGTGRNVSPNRPSSSSGS
ncbi:nuclear transport factor 2 family protein [Aerosakkonema funiforme]|uniref:Nuclear transport factor 2 family protein n=1 Tax=Aerosakkonema funiforme FACHB-1375 TaxID=2949571 RepID=A0A926VCW8_9CYAN|nr:nuclear transport factor 2 family protein [Aerosakkonema funiforme]MBD2181498.1 nuclear transport factor 2 family protein [Aerosakkonema funiforme FACHB-1375]